MLLLLDALDVEEVADTFAYLLVAGSTHDPLHGGHPVQTLVSAADVLTGTTNRHRLHVLGSGHKYRFLPKRRPQHINKRTFS